ncbi:MAG: hypothetical protein ACLUIX_03245 [Oscillospiraceae bacterium]
MRKLKKWSRLSLALLMLSALAACGKKRSRQRCLAERGAGHRYPTG